MRSVGSPRYASPLHDSPPSPLDRKELQKLRDVGMPMSNRAAEVGAREAAQQRASKFVTAAKESLASWHINRHWIPESKSAAMLKQVRSACTS